MLSTNSTPPAPFPESTRWSAITSRRTSLARSCSLAATGLILVGCQFNGTGAGGWAPSPYGSGVPNAGPRSAPIKISSEILSGTRESDEYSETVEVSVRVVGSGEPLGYYKSSTLDISTGTFWLSAEDRWLNFGGLDSGWPERYLVTAEYEEFLSAGGSVVVTVTVDDFGHDQYGREIYRATHDLVWE